jgi:hypothetical protein
MTVNLTDISINESFDQLLHVSDGPTATEKVVYSGTGVATALHVGTVSASVGDVRFSGDTITTITTDADLVLDPNGTGVVDIARVAFGDASQARGALSLGTIATQDSDDVDITGGSITGVVFTGSFTGITAITSDAFYTSAAAAGLTLTNNDLLADGTDTNIDIDLIPKGTGKVGIPKVEIDTVSAPHEYGIFYDLSDQTFAADTPTTVEFDTTGSTDATSVVSNSQITFTNAGTYEVTSRLQFQNTNGADRVADIWFRLSGVDIPNSASEISVPKATDGGKVNHTITGILTVTAGQYVEVVVAVEDADTSLHYHAPLTTPGDAYNRPAVPSAIIVVRRLV